MVQASNHHIEKTLKAPAFPVHLLLITASAVFNALTGYALIRNVVLPIPSTFMLILQVFLGLMAQLFGWVLGATILRVSKSTSSTFRVWGDTYILAFFWGLLTLALVIWLSPDFSNGDVQGIDALTKIQARFRESQLGQFIQYGGYAISLVQVGYAFLQLKHDHAPRATQAALVLAACLGAVYLLPMLLQLFIKS
jgi:hypothetical protein